MTAENDVRAASAKFYEGLNRMLNGDAGSLAEIWSHGSTVTAMHPLGGREIGWERIRETFEHVAQVSTGGHVELVDQFIQVAGDTAYELGVERGQFSPAGRPVSVDARVTNIYRRQAGAWKIVHHHGDISPGIVDAIPPAEDA